MYYVEGQSGCFLSKECSSCLLCGLLTPDNDLVPQSPRRGEGKKVSNNISVPHYRVILSKFSWFFVPLMSCIFFHTSFVKNTHKPKHRATHAPTYTKGCHLRPIVNIGQSTYCSFMSPGAIIEDLFFLGFSLLLFLRIGQHFSVGT